LGGDALAVGISGSSSSFSVAAVDVVGGGSGFFLKNVVREVCTTNLTLSVNFCVGCKEIGDFSGDISEFLGVRVLLLKQCQALIYLLKGLCQLLGYESFW
jgi:hypothetical protein